MCQEEFDSIKKKQCSSKLPVPVLEEMEACIALSGISKNEFIAEALIVYCRRVRQLHTRGAFMSRKTDKEIFLKMIQEECLELEKRLIDAVGIEFSCCQTVTESIGLPK